MMLSLLEALAAGLPYITTGAGAMPDVIRPEVDGLLVPPGDRPALARALLRARLGSRARETMRASTWQRSVLQHVSAFTQVLRRAASGATGV